MGCVNRSSKEFKQLALTNNVDANTLELITHKYWMERGSEDLFPTDLYIQAQLGNTQYQEPGESVRQLWKQQYSSPQEYSSLEQLQIAHREATKFFPQSALVHYKDAKGNFVLSVKQPVESANYDKDSFFNEDNVKKLDLGLEEGQAYTIDKVEELFNRFNTDKTTKHLADKVFKIAKDLGLGIKFDQSLPWGNIGRYTSNNTITYKKSFFELDIRNNMKAPILLHEVLHALSMYALSKQTAKWEKPEQLKQFKTEMNSIFEQVKDNPLLKGEKGVEDIYEFVAELANPIFCQKLQSIDKKSVWHKILDAFKSFLGIKTTSTYYQRAMNSLDNALEAFDLDTYLRYNGVRNLMQQGYDANEWQFRDMTEGELKEAVKDYFKQQLPISTELKPETQKTLDQAKKEAKASRSNFTYATETDDTGEYQKQSVQQRMDDFMSHYGDLVKDIKPFSNKYGGMSFTVTFKTPTELLRDQNSEILSQLSLIDSMSKDQLISEFALIEQEYADYDLITEDGTKDSEKSSTFASDMAKSGNKKSVGPQPFTFNDGTTVTAPFKPNAQQAAALNAMNDFVHSDETSMTLSGYAGTGKTSLMELLAQKMRKERKDVRFCATTNKAAAVLKARVAKAGFDAQTLNKVFGINVEVDATKAYNARNLVTALKEADVFPGTTVIIDEASMINEENYRILNGIAQQHGLKIIYVGDKAQLAPVNETQVSKVFRNNEGRVVELTQVERTDDNAILKEATNIRNGKPLSGESSFNEKGEGVAFLTKKSNEQINDVIKHYIQGLQNDPNYFRILAYTNKAVTDYNNYVRNLLGYEDPIPHVGEPVVGYANWGYEWRTKSYRFINSESYKVVGVGNPTTKQIFVNGETITMETVPITLQNSIGEMDTFNFMDIKSNQNNRQAAIQLANAKKQLWEKARRAVGRNEKAEIYQAINSIDQFLFVNDNIEDANHNLLQAKTLDFGYALTIHKSQGSTFTHVLMDDIDVAKASNSNNAADAMSMVDLGQVNVPTSAMEVQVTEDVDLGDLSAVEATPATTTDNNTANVRQQLEYVGVSRATNTVTVISNNVKKEDSPLNHLEQKTETPQKPVDKRFQFRSKPFENEIKGGDFVVGTIDRKKVYARVHDNGRDGNPYAHMEIDGIQDTYNLDSNGNIQYAFPENMVAPLDVDKAYPAKKEALLNLQDILRKMEKAKKGVIFYEDGTSSEEVSENLNKVETPNSHEVKADNLNENKAENSTENEVSEGQRVSLPSYEYFMDRYEDTLVDAEWKVPLLKQLEEQLTKASEALLPTYSTENTQFGVDLRDEILDKMTKILEAKSEADLLPQTEEEGKKENKTVETNLSEYDKLTQQINNLLDSNVITASEIRHIAELVVNSISDNITLLQKEDGLAQEQFSTLQTDLDFSTASRRDIVNAVGINRLIHRAKVLFSPEVANYEDIETMMQAALITDNWDAIMTLAADIFAANEGFGISRDFDKGGFKAVDGTNVGYDNFNNEGQDTETIEETEGDEQEHWQVESRTIDVLNSMSALVRLALHECYQVDKDGNKVYSKWGIAERVNSRQAVNSILRWTQGSLSLQDMISKLSNKQSENPWLTQLIDRLSDQSGKETDFQSQFYGVFSKHFQPYSIVLLEDGKYSSMPVNNHPALSEAMQTITTQFKIGEHPLFTDGKVNIKLLGTENTTYPEADFNLHKALANLNTIKDRLNHQEELNDSMAKEATANIMGICRIMGYPVTEEMLSDVMNKENILKMIHSLGFIVKSLDAAYAEQRRDSSKQYNPFAFGVDNSIGGTLRNFLTPITEKLEDTAINAFYDSGKMYQSYVTPSFMTKLMNKFRLKGQEFEDFIMNEYGNSEWFKFPGGDFNKGWRNEWLRLLARDENARKVFDHKVELNFNKHNYMRNMSDAEYTLSLITEYFAETGQKGQSMVPAWFRIPMLSNKPSSEFVKFMSYRGDNYKAEIVNGLYQMFLQELSRIQTVRMRNHSKGDAEFINNFDINGRKFNFLPFLNEFLDESNHSELGNLLKKKIEGLTALSAEEETRLSTLVDQAIRQNMEDRVNSILDKWENSGILEAAKSIKGIGEEDMIRANVENFLWNDNFASKNILQLTIADIAFYKDAEDLQKRLAQLHAPGIRGNVAATDYEGNRVSDGTYRTFILQDFDSFKSNIIANIAEVFDRRIAAAPESQKAGLKALKESLVGKDGKYTKINVTDAQGYSSPASYRKKAFIFGRWSREAEDIYQKLQRGEYTYTDLETAFQPLKPFVYSHLQKDMGVENAPIQNMPVPFQAKNAEYLLIMADAILQGEELGRPNLLRAVYRVMEESERLNPTKGIDTVQFESAIKSGLQGKINIHQFAEMPNGEEAAYNYIMSQIYQKDTTQYDAETFVHEAPYEDYCLQQEVPEHFKEHSQAHGSQIRMITPSDLDFYKNPSADHSDPNNQVFYEWTEPDGTKKKLRADEFRREYEETIAANISESIDNLAAELHFNSNDKRERNIALSKILQREILSSPRYGIDLIQACSIDKETGEFRIPKGDPIQAKRIEQLINSIIKNRVNKQKIAGGPIVQVSNFGTSRQLHIRFNDKNGGVLMTKEEYEQNPQKKQMSQTDKFNAKYKGKATSDTMSYEEYVKENQAGIAYFEVFIPIWSNELFEKFANNDGTINVAAIEATDPELLKMVSYRIPTEDKYSCAPMKAVGFMPREAGDAIMFPYELTEIDDSDFDVDKRYVMRKDIPIKRRKRSEIEQKLFEKVSESYQKSHEGKTANKFIAEQIKMFLDNSDKMRHTDALMESLYYEYQKIAYYTEAPTSGKAYRDNKIVDMTLAVLTNEVTADKILNPGGFDGPKKMGYMVAAYKNPGNNYTWQQLQGMSISELKDACYTDKDLTWADTQIQFYKQNSAAASLIGVFAVNKVAHATLESNGYQVAVDEICGQEPFTIADTEFGGRMEIDKKYDQNGALIGKTLGSLVSASADAVKDPILNLMNVNMTTAGMLNSMLRLGMSFDDAALFLSQDVIERALNEFNRQNLTNYQPLSTIIDEYLRAYRKKYNLTDDSNINFEPLTREELVEGLLPQEHEATDYKVLLTFQKLRKLVDAMRKPTFATRFNSISSAVGPLIIDNLITEHRIEQFMDSSNEDGTHFYDAEGNIVDIDDIFYDHPVLKQFARTVDIARQMFGDMPAGSVGFRNLLRTLPEGLSDKIYNDKKLLDQLSNFYQSYLLVASRMINTNQLKNYIEGFPKWFMKQEFKEKYPENALIQAIRMNVSKRTGRPYLSINITGIDEAKKEQYRNAWIDLHKDNPDLSRKLFDYCFFRAGVGFSPKTFMALVPAYVKERLNTKLGNDTQATYLDTYRHFPAVNPNVVIDQFIRNNWDNNKLVPKKGGEGTKYQVDLKNGSIVVRDPSDIADLKGVTYMKTRHNGQTYLWKQTFEGKDVINYTRVKPLGNNAEYLEMSLENIMNPLSETAQTLEDMDTAELQTPSPAETDAAETSTSEVITDNERAKAVAELADLLMKQNPRFNKTEALNKIEEMKKNPKLYVKFLQNVFKQKGLNLNEEDTLNEFKKLC